MKSFTTISDSRNLWINFEIKYNTKFGSSMFISGNIPELGNWDVERAFKMEWRKVSKFLYL